MNLSIEAKGDTTDNAKIWINDLDVFINGKSIRELNTTGKGIKGALPKKRIVSIDNKRQNSFPFMSRKILAIGETIHGTETLNNAAIEVIKERIIQHNCKLVLLEIPFEYSFYLNRCIAGDPHFKIDAISSYFDRVLFSYSFLSLIEWIKEYNSHSEKKVYLWGIDVNPIQLQSKLELYSTPT